jgi:hypothetical protein
LGVPDGSGGGELVLKRLKDGIDVQGKAPGFWYYPTDFERDLQMLSLSAQGLWIRMMGWMHYCENRGYLELPTGIAMTEDDIAARAGKPKKEITKSIAEMERIGLFSRDERGCIFNRRMVKDAHISRVRKAAVAARLLDAERDEHGRFAGHFDGSKSPQITVLSSSSSSSSSPKGKNTIAAAAFDYEDGFSELWQAYPKRGRSDIEDAKRWYIERVQPDPERIHGLIMAAVAHGGKWQQSDLWQRGYVKKLTEFLRNSKWLEDPEPYSNRPQGNNRETAIEKSRKSIEEMDFSAIDQA